MGSTPDQSREYYLKNSDKIKQYQKEYNKNNRDILNQRLLSARIADPAKYLFTAAKTRAKKKGYDFSIEVTDIIVPTYCPILGLQLQMNVGAVRNNSPTLDRVDNTKGYIKGNVAVISYKANSLKSNMSIRDFEKFIEYMKGFSE